MTSILDKKEKQLYSEIEILKQQLQESEQQILELKNDSREQKINGALPKSIKNSENNLRALFNAMTDIVFEMDYDGTYLNIAPTSPELMYVSPNNMNGKRLHDVFPKEEADNFLKFVRSCIDDQEVKIIEYSLTIDNETLWFEGKGAPKSENTILYIARNVSQQKRVEKSLSDKTIMLDNILKSSINMAIVITDLDLRITYFNPLADKFFGMKPENSININLLDILKTVEKKQLQHEIKSLNKTGEFLFSINQKTDDGIRYLSSRITEVLNSDSETTAYVFFSTDITERKKSEEERERINIQINSANQQLLSNEKQLKAFNQQLIDSEERYKKIFNYAPIGILVVDIEGFPISVNRQVLEILDSPSVEATRKINVLKFKNLIDIGFSSDFKKCISTGDVVHNENLYESKWNKRVYYKYILAPIFNEKHDVTAVQVIIEDVSVRKNAENKLKVEREKSLAILDGIDDIMYVSDPDSYELLHFNDTAKNLFGVESLGKKCYNIIQNMDSPCPFCTNDIIFGEKLGQTHFWEHYSDKYEKWYRCADKAIEWENGKMVRFELASDISDRKKTEDKLDFSEKRYFQLYENAPDMFFSTNANGVVISVNEFGAKNLGYAKKELVGESVWKVVHTEDLPFVKEHINSAIKDKISKSELEFRMVCKNGSTIFVQERLNFNYKKSETEIQIICRDVTSQKHEERIKRVIYNISNAVLSTSNLEEYLEIIEEELSKIIDTTNFYIALYDRETDHFSLPFHRDKTEHIETFAAGKSLTNYIVKNKKSLLVTKEDKQKLIDTGDIELVGINSEIWLGVPLVVKGKVIGAIAVQSYEDEKAYNHHDLEMLEVVSRQISVSMERKIAETELKDALAKAVESDRLKTAFLLNMSHEIRTPMNGILGFLSLLDDPTYSISERKEFSDIINKSSDRLLNTITNLISISKIEAGQMSVSKRETFINKMFEELFSTFNPKAKAENLTLTSHPTLIDEMATINTDEGKLLSIMSNLLKNAIKYTEEGCISFGYNQNGKILEFYVKDSGIGVPIDRQEAVFNRFEQADIEDTRAFEGSGLGLAIAKSYVEMLGGRIWLVSEENIGSEFRFTLPYNNKKYKSYIERESTIFTKNDKSVPNLKVLVVEDEDIGTIYLNSILKNKFNEIFYAENGKEAVEICRSNLDIDLILMDIKMPIMNGYDATREIRTFNSDVIIIAQTAYALEGDRKKSIDAGCDDYVSKPINHNKLIEIIKKFLGDKWTF